MERTKHKQGVLFTERQTKRTEPGMVGGVDKANREIKEFLIPTLRKYGYDGKLIRNIDFLRKQKKKEYESFADISPRAMLRSPGWFLEIFPKDNPKYRIPVKAFVIQSTDPKHLGNRPRLNLPAVFLEELAKYPVGTHPHIVWNKMWSLDLHFLIMTKTGRFWMNTFHSINHPQWVFTYRNDPKNLDRIAASPKAQVKTFDSIEKDLANRLQTLMYYYNKNFNYVSE
jgi:hypothetical protein